MIQSMVDRVTAFHEKHGFPTKITEHLEEVDKSLMMLGAYLIGTSKEILESGIMAQGLGDPRLYRVHLEFEELGERLVAMAKRDDVAILDGGIDQLFVLLGTIGATYQFPLDEAWEEVCRSNESKQVRSPDNPRMRDKGPDYIAPDLERILNEHWCNHEWINHERDGCRIFMECKFCGKSGVEYA